METYFYDFIFAIFKFASYYLLEHSSSVNNTLY